MEKRLGCFLFRLLACPFSRADDLLRLGCFLFRLLACPFSRANDLLKSRSCSSEGLISAGAVRVAGSYLASSFIGENLEMCAAFAPPFSGGAVLAVFQSEIDLGVGLDSHLVSI